MIKRRPLIGTSVIAMVFMILLVTPVSAIRGSITVNLVGRGTATTGGLSTDFRMVFILGIKGHNETTIWGIGKGWIFGPAMTDIKFRTIRWSFNRIDKTLNIIGKISAETDDVLYLSGTAVGNPGKAPRAIVELSGTLSWQTEILEMTIIASIFADAPNYDWMDL